MNRSDFFAQPRGFARSLRFRLLTSLANSLVQTPLEPILGNARRARGAGGKIKSGGRKALGAAAGALSLTALLSHAAQAQNLPQGGSVVAGNASINQATPNSLNVVQTTNSAIINWQSFNVGAGNSVNFQQPSASSITLNRVLGNDPSSIFGTITANGTVMLVNPNGVFFGPGSRVDVGGLVATTANIKDADFLAGKYLFGTPSSNANAMVVNQGDISIKDAGLAALVAPGVQNNGVIRARLGRVALGGAQSFTLDFHGDGLLSFGAGSQVAAVPQNADGSQAAALVVNTGQISAEGGVIELSARAVKGVIDNVINTSGVVSAKSVSTQNGKIVLSGGDSGKVAISGTVDASGSNAGETGGSIIATGAAIAVASNTTMDTSGQAGGGLIAIGSDGSGAGARGTGAWAGSVSVASGAQLKADALDHGKGGTVVVLAEDKTVFAGQISARGGAQGGDGGFAEVSAKQDIVLTGGADLSAAKGKTGTLLIDPANLKIVSGTSGTGKQDTAGGDGSVAAGDADNDTNTISQGLLESLNATTNIVLEATGLITVDTMSGGVLNLKTGASNSFTLRSTTTGGITFTDANTEIRTNGGAIVLQANGLASSITNLGKLTSNNGNITVSASNAVGLANAVNAGTGTVSITATSGAITGNASATLTGATVKLNAGSTGIGTSSQSISTTADNLSLATAGNFYIANSKALTGLTVDVSGAGTTANSYTLTAGGGQTFSFTDDASTLTVAGNSTSAVAYTLTALRNLQVGSLNVSTGAVGLTSTGGNIESTSSGSLLTGGAITLVARGSSGVNGKIGSAASPLLMAASSLTATAGTGIISVKNTGALTLSSLISSSTEANSIEATGSISVGSVSVVPASGNGKLTLASSAGSINDDGNSSTSISLGGSGTLTLNASTSVGSSGSKIATNAASISGTAGNGGFYVASSSTSAVTFSNITTTAGVIVLDALDASGVTLSGLTSSNGTSDITVVGKGGLTLGAISAGANGNVTLTANTGAINSSGGSVTANKLILSATSSNASISVQSAAKEIEATANSGVTITQSGAVTLTSVNAGSGNISVNSSTGAITVGKLTAIGTATLTASSGAIIGGTDNRLQASAVTLSSSADIGSNANNLVTATTSLSITNTGSYYIDNTDRLLTSLVINNKHNGSDANTLVLKSTGVAFDATDDGSKTTLSKAGGPTLTKFTYTSDKGLVLGQLDLDNVESVQLKATSGDILDDSNANTRITTKRDLILEATAGSIGASGAAISSNAIRLSATAKGNIHLSSLSDLTDLGISHTHVDTDTVNTFSVTAKNLEFALTDDKTGGYTLSRMVDGTGLTYFTLAGDRNITLGHIDVGTSTESRQLEGEQGSTNVGYNALIRTTNGSILDDGDNTTKVIANRVSLVATKAIGATGNGQIDVVAYGASAQASDGGIYMAARAAGSDNTTNEFQLGEGRTGSSGSATRAFSATGDINFTLDAGNLSLRSNVSTSGGDISITATTGSILNSSSNTISASGSGKMVTLSAAGSLGSSGQALNVTASKLSATAGTGVTLSAVGSMDLASITSGADITLTGSSSLTIGAINANSGANAVSINASGSINGYSGSGTLISGSTVTLTSSSNIGGNDTVKLNAGKAVLSASGGLGISNQVAFTDLEIIRNGSTGSIAISSTGAQSFTLSDSGSEFYAQTVSSTAALNLKLSSSARSIKLGTLSLGASGSLTATSTLTAGNITSAGGSSKITAGTITLAAGTTGSIGTSGTKIAVNGGKLDVTAGRNIYVANDIAYTDLTINSTNSTTAGNTASLFSLSGGSQAFSITDDGTTNSLDVTNSSGLNFSFTSKKNISVSEIVATGGSVSLITSGGGSNSNITMSGGGSILASTVTLSANGTGTGNGSIGTSSRSVKTAATSLTLVSNGNVYLDNSSTAITTFSLTASHKTAATSDVNTYTLANLGSGRSVTVSDSAGTMDIAAASSAALDFTFIADRAISTGTITAGTNSTGKVTLQATGGATGVAGSINRDSGTITAGQVSLTSNGTGGIGNSGQIATSTKVLSLKTGGDLSVSNNTTLTDLTLDINFSKSGTTTYTHSLTATGLTLTIDEVVSGGSVNALKLTSISQSGLNLTVKSSKAIQATSVNVGTLTINTSGAFNSTQNNTSTSAVTATTLDVTATSIGNTNSGQTYFTGNVTTLKATTTDRISYNDLDSVALGGVTSSYVPESGSSSIAVDIKVAGNITQSSGVLKASSVKLTATAGSIGASGTALQIDTYDALEISSGRHVYLSNADDLNQLKWTLTHSSAGSQNIYSVTGKNLSLSLTDSGSGNLYTLSNLVDVSGLKLNLTTDMSIQLGIVNVQADRDLTLITSGATKDITSINGTSLVTANTLTLEASGSITDGPSSSALNTAAKNLVLITGKDIKLANSVDLSGLSVTSKETSLNSATLAITAPKLTLTATNVGSVTTFTELTDTTGLTAVFDIKDKVEIAKINVGVSGSLSITTANNYIIGADNADAATKRIVAGEVTLASAGDVGTSTNGIHVTAPLLTINSVGNVYVDSDRHIEKLTWVDSYTSTTSQTYDINSVTTAGTATELVTGSYANATGATLTKVADTTGTDFDFKASKSIVIGSIDVGSSGTVKITSGVNISDDGDGGGETQIKAARLELYASSGYAGQASGTGNGQIDATAGTIKITANNGAHLNLHGATQIEGFEVAGTSSIVNDAGDIALTSMSLNGAALTVNNSAGSITSGSISGAGTLSLTAGGSIGNLSAITTAANNGGTTTLTANSTTNNRGATGSINISETSSLTISSIDSAGAVTLQTTGSFSTYNLTIAGLINAQQEAVTLKANNGSILSTTSAEMNAGSLTMTASGTIGAGTNSNTKIKTTATKLTVNALSDIYVISSSDLTDLTIDRTPTVGTSNSSGVLEIGATNLTWGSVSDSSGVITFGNVVDTTGLNFSYTSRGNIVVNTMNLGSGTVSLTAKQGVSSTAATITGTGTNKLTAGALTLAASTGTAAAIGSSETALGVNVSSLTASAGNGGVYIKSDSAALTVLNATSTGALSLSAGVGDLTVKNFSYTNSNALNFTSTAGSVLFTQGLTVGTGSITLSAANGLGANGQPLRITGGGTGALTANVTGTGGLYLDVNGSLNGGLSSTVKNGSMVVTTNNAIKLTSLAITDDVLGNDISVIGSSGSITVVSVSAGSENGAVTLKAAASVLANANGSTVTGSRVNITGTSGIGSSSNRLGVNSKAATLATTNSAIYGAASGVTTLSSVRSGTGIVDITFDGSLYAADVVTNNANITFASSGSASNQPFVIGSIDAGTGLVQITSSIGGVYDDGIDTSRLTASSAVITAKNGIGTSDRRVQTTTSGLTLTSDTGGSGIYLDSNTSGGVNISATAKSGGVDITTAGATTVTLLKSEDTTSASKIKLVGSSGDVTITSVVADTTNGDVQITSAAKIAGNGSGTHVTGKTVTLTSASGIGSLTDFATATGTSLNLNAGTISGLTASSDKSTIFVKSTSALSLGTNFVTMGKDGTALIASDGNITLTGSVSANVLNFGLSSGGTLTLPTATLSNTGKLYLKGTTDVVVTGGGAREYTLSGSDITFISGAAGGNTKLTTTTTSLIANLTGAGDLTVSNTGNLSTAKLSTSNGNVDATSSSGITATQVSLGGTGKTATLTATKGDVTATSITGGTGTVKLVAAAGSVLIGDGATLTGNVLDITTFGAIGTVGTPFTSSFTTLNAKITGSGDMHIGYGNGNSTTGTLITADGDIFLTAGTGGTLTVDGTKLTAGNSGNVSIKSSGNVTLNQAYTTTGGNTAKAGLSIEASTISLAGASTTGAQSYKGATVIKGNLTGKSITIDGTSQFDQAATLSTAAANGDIKLTNTLDGVLNNVTFNAGTGTVSLVGAAGNLGSLTITGGNIELASVETSGAQSYTGSTKLNGSSYTTGGNAFTITGATLLTQDATIGTTGGAVLFDGSVNGAKNITVNSGAGNTSFTGELGGTTRLGAIVVNSSGATKFTGGSKSASIVTDAGGTLTLGGNIDTTGVQTYAEKASLSANTSFTGTTVTLSQGANGSASGAQTIGVTGNLVLNGGFGTGTEAVGSLTVSGTTTLGITAVTTTGVQTYTGSVALSDGTTTFTGSTVSLLGGATNAAGSNIAVVGNAAFTGSFGTTNQLGTVNVSGTTTFGGGTIVTSTKQTYTGAVNITGNQTLTDNSVATIIFGDTLDSSNQSNLTLNIGDSTLAFNHAVGGTGKLGTLTINAGTNGKTEFASSASLKLAGDLVQTSGVSLLLPASVDVGGAITLGVVTSTGTDPQAITGIATKLAEGKVSISAGKDVVMASLVGSETDLTINSTGGFIKVGSKNVGEPDPAKKILVKTLTSSQATAINMYGTVANRSDKTAAYIVGPLKNPPYFINDMRWGPEDVAVTIPPSVVPPVNTVPSTPAATSLFTGNITPAGITPNALGAFTAPPVLTVSNAGPVLGGSSLPQGGGINPGIVAPSSGGPVITAPGPAPVPQSGGSPTGGLTPAPQPQGQAQPQGQGQPQSQAQPQGQGQGQGQQPQGQAQPQGQGQPQDEQQRPASGG